MWLERTSPASYRRHSLMTSGFTGKPPPQAWIHWEHLLPLQGTPSCVGGGCGFLCGGGGGVCVWGGWGSTEFKLWQLKRIIKLRGGELQLISTASTVDRISKILWFSESLENFLSNDVFQSKNFRGAIICHFSALDHGLLFMVSPNWQIFLSFK